jgi:solute carrier family 25 phosphate transporter 23/24/25/41
VAKIMPETAIKFGSYEAAKRAFANLEGHADPTRISTYSKFTAGGVAGMVAQ